MIRKAVLVVLFTALPFAAHAQGYIEGNLGFAFVGDIDGDFEGSDGMTTESGTFSLQFENEFMWGIEAGFTGFGNVGNVGNVGNTGGGLRFGVSWDHLKPELEGADLSVTGFGSQSFTCSDEPQICSELSLKTNIVLANLYYDFATDDAPFIPFVGFGLGAAFIEDSDTEFAMAGTLGARIPLGNAFYLGGRYRFHWIQGASESFSDSGISASLAYDSITSHSISAIIGASF